MVKIDGKIICSFTTSPKGMICRYPSDMGPFVALDRRCKITPVSGRDYVVKILTTAQSGKIRFGEIIPIELANFFQPLREAVRLKIPHIVWREGSYSKQEKFVWASYDVELQGNEYGYYFSPDNKGGVRASPEIDHYLDGFQDAIFDFTPAETGLSSMPKPVSWEDNPIG